MRSLILVCTVDSRLEKLAEYRRLVESVRANMVNAPLSVRLWTLFQTFPPDAFATATVALPDFVIARRTEARLSLSAARNVLLQEIFAVEALGAQSILAFPDDDCWYAPGYFAALARLFDARPQIGLLTARYGSAPASLEPDALISAPAARVRDLVRSASSVTMTVRGDLAMRLGPFDERFGIGAPLGSSEDTDYVLRARALGAQSAFVDATLVGHRDRAPTVPLKYYRGSLMAIARHARRPAVAYEYVRKLAVGLTWVLRGRMTAGDYVRWASESVAEALGKQAAGDVRTTAG